MKRKETMNRTITIERREQTRHETELAKAVHELINDLKKVEKAGKHIGVPMLANHVMMDVAQIMVGCLHVACPAEEKKKEVNPCHQTKQNAPMSSAPERSSKTDNRRLNMGVIVHSNCPTGQPDFTATSIPQPGIFCNRRRVVFDWNSRIFRRRIVHVCEECLRTPCASTCPNAVDEGIYCASCGDLLIEGDFIYAIGGHFWCESCIHSARDTL